MGTHNIILETSIIFNDMSEHTLLIRVIIVAINRIDIAYDALRLHYTELQCILFIYFNIILCSGVYLYLQNQILYCCGLQNKRLY